LANMILDITIRHNAKDFGIRNVLKKHSWKNTQAADELLTKIENSHLSDFEFRDSFRLLSEMSEESLAPHKDRVAFLKAKYARN